VAPPDRLQRGAEPPPLRGAARSACTPAPSPEGEAVAAEERARLLSALDSLPEEQRLTIAFRYLLDLSEEETAAALGVRRGTVKSRLARALDRLREVHADV
jgi:RNA polymerase sigma factor (sigma-70 family)